MAYSPGSFSELIFADEVTDNLEEDIEAIKRRIQDTNIRLDGVITEKVTLEEVLTSLDTEIISLQAAITATQQEIDRLNREITGLEIEIEAQTEVLERILVLLYQNSDISTFELIITADSFSDYLDEQENLERLREGVGDSVERISNLSIELEEEQAHLTAFLDDQKAQEIALRAVRWEKQQLLNDTLNQEQLFQQQLAQLQAEQEQFERDLEAYLASLIATRVSLGEVNAGDVVGKNGNTGWSTGPHLHIVIYNPGAARYDPLDFIHQRNLVWPMGGSGGWVSQGFHAGHQALDIAASEGTPVRAIADGTIIHRGCFEPSNPNLQNFMVIIDHGGYHSLYAHLQAPNNPRYEACSINRRNNFGVKSVDYSTTE